MPCATIDTPIGLLAIESDGTSLTRLYWTTEPRDTTGHGCDPLLAEAGKQLNAYLAGNLQSFDLPLAPAATPRGTTLRAAIAAIPYGQTASYGQVARTAGSAARAVGQACARNPFPIIIPCHRVLAARGALGHYSGGQGVETKLALLRLESSDFHPN